MICNVNGQNDLFKLAEKEARTCDLLHGLLDSADILRKELDIFRTDIMSIADRVRTGYPTSDDFEAKSARNKMLFAFNAEAAAEINNLHLWLSSGEFTLKTCQTILDKRDYVVGESLDPDTMGSNMVYVLLRLMRAIRIALHDGRRFILEEHIKSNKSQISKTCTGKYRQVTLANMHSYITRVVALIRSLHDTWDFILADTNPDSPIRELPPEYMRAYYDIISYSLYSYLEKSSSVSTCSYYDLCYYLYKYRISWVNQTVDELLDEIRRGTNLGKLIDDNESGDRDSLAAGLYKTLYKVMASEIKLTESDIGDDNQLKPSSMNFIRCYVKRRYISILESAKEKYDCEHETNVTDANETNNGSGFCG